MNGISGRTMARMAKLVFKCVADKLECHRAKCKGCVNGTAVTKRLCFHRMQTDGDNWGKWGQRVGRDSERRMEDN